MTDTKSWPGAEPGEPLTLTAGVWPLLGRTLLVMIGQLLIIPSPWTSTSYYRWFVQHTRLPYGRQVAFTGQPGDVWYIFILGALCGYIGAVNDWLELVSIPLSALFYLIIGRWFFAKLTCDGRSPLTFTGGYWQFLGWTLLFAISFLTVIGWAWVMTGTMRWACRSVEGSDLRLSFVASGWGVLWRSLLFALSCIVIIPIPWTLRWYMAWMVSQTCLSERPAVT